MAIFPFKKQILIPAYLLLVCGLHWNAILKADDPISEGQSEAILYDQKMEQDKDGVKAPATPKMIYYGGQGFLTKNSLSKYEKEITAVTTGKKRENFNWSDWWEEKPADTAPEEQQTLLQDDMPTVAADESLMVPDEIEPLSEEVPQNAVSADAEEALPPPAELESEPAGSDWW